jgi:hypothetical protein
VPSGAVGGGHFSTEGAVVGWGGHADSCSLPSCSGESGHVLSLAIVTVVVDDGHVLSARESLFASERPVRTPKATTVEKAATSIERSILFRIVGFVLT